MQIRSLVAEFYCYFVQMQVMTLHFVTYVLYVSTTKWRIKEQQFLNSSGTICDNILALFQPSCFQRKQINLNMLYRDNNYSLKLMRYNWKAEEVDRARHFLAPRVLWARISARHRALHERRARCLTVLFPGNTDGARDVSSCRAPASTALRRLKHVSCQFWLHRAYFSLRTECICFPCCACEVEVQLPISRRKGTGWERREGERKEEASQGIWGSLCKISIHDAF